MTGEMTRPKYAELGEEYWKGRSTSWGSVRGDEGILVRPNYPDIFALSDKLKDEGIENEVCRFDVYQGPYIGFDEVRFPHPLRIWYSEKYPLFKWLIVSEVQCVDVFEDEQAIEMISALLPLLRIRQC
jgi:hypothetical protein